MSARSRYVDWIDYGDRHVLAIGTGAPWDRPVAIRVPKFIAKFFGGKK